MECTATILRYIYSMQFMWLMATLIIQPASPFGADVVCENHPGFPMTKVQVEMCKNYSQLLPAFENAFKTFERQLQHHFKHEKWNGSNIIPPIFGEKPDDFLRKLSKESAFVYALASATVVHTVADSCMKEDSLPFCGCDQNLKDKELPEGEKWAGCSPDMEFAFNFAKKFLDRRVDNYPIKDKHFVLHNNKLGRSIVKSYMHKTCTCVGNGDSNICSKENTCQIILPKMQEIGDILIEKYYKSVHSKLKSQSGHLDETKIIDRKNDQTVKPDQMIHFDSSPDYCEPAPLYNIEGVAGRECTQNASRASHQSHCDNLCCGRGSEPYIVKKLTTCNCKFVWCCRVECESCLKDVTKHRCK